MLSLKGLIPISIIFSILINLFGSVNAYQVLISSSDEVRQSCSGMYGSGGVQDPFIEVIFSPSSKGQLALVIFEWEDAKYLGVNPTGVAPIDDAWSEDRVYICTLSALESKLCKEADLGTFIITPPTDGSNTTIFTSSVQFDKLEPAKRSLSTRQTSGPFRYKVSKTGFYCVGTVPVVVEGKSQDPISGSSSFSGVVDFENVFDGRLPATEWPKISFYRTLFLIYCVIGIYWTVLCYKNKSDLIAIQWYILATIAFLIFEMFVMWRSYVYSNTTAHIGVSRALLILVSILNAGRNSLSFFMLLITSMGYGVVKPSLGKVMLKVRILALIHFVFGVMYSLGTVSIAIENAGILIFLFVFPLAFTLTAFLMWIMYALNATIADLDDRKQTYKKAMFTRLYRVLVLTVLSMFTFFILTSLLFSSRTNEDFIPRTWPYRWILLDGFLGSLYLTAFSSIAYLWRPTGNNTLLGLSDELPMNDDDDADDGMEREDVDELEEFEVEDTEGNGGRSVRMKKLRDDSVVFDVGDEDEDNDDEESGVGMEGRRLTRGGSDDDEDHKGAPPSYKDA